MADELSPVENDDDDEAEECPPAELDHSESASEYSVRDASLLM